MLAFETCKYHICYVVFLSVGSMLAIVFASNNNFYAYVDDE